MTSKYIYLGQSILQIYVAGIVCRNLNYPFTYLSVKYPAVVVLVNMIWGIIIFRPEEWITDYLLIKIIGREDLNTTG